MPDHVVPGLEEKVADLLEAMGEADYMVVAGAVVQVCQEHYSPLLRLILTDMPAATNQNLACDGPVGDEEGKVWRRIEDEARRLAALKEPSDAN